MVKIFPLKKRDARGFSAVELIIVVLVIAIIVMLALPQIMSSRRLFQFSGVQRQVTGLIREARQEAVSQRAPITFRYDNASKTVILTGGNFGLLGDSRNRVSQLAGEGVSPDQIIYGRPADFSTAALGDGTNLTPLAGNALEITFQSDGSVIDAGNNPQNKALFFFCSEATAETAFAVSILGAGGRAKLWRYTANANAYVE